MAEKQSILGRIAQLTRANINALLDRAEDPQKMLDQLVRDYTASIAEARDAVAQTIGNLRLAEKDHAADVAEARDWGAKALAASQKADQLRSGGDAAGADKWDSLAKIALTKQITAENEAKAAEPMIASQRQVVEQLKTGLTGTGKYENRQITRQAIDFFDQNANSVRFNDWPFPKGSKTGDNPAGYIARNSVGNPEYLIIPAVFESEICGTYEPQKVCMVLHEIGWLNKPKSGGWKVQKKQSGGTVRFYSFNNATPPDAADME